MSLMNETIIDLIRHGQSQGNVREIFLGHSDWDLSPLGFLQASLCAEHLKDVPYSAVYSSDLIRAVHTAQPLSDAHGLVVQTSCALRELYAGAWEGKPYAALERQYPESFSRWRKDIFAVTPVDGEDPRDLARRVTEYLTSLAQKHAGERIAVFTHATAIRAFCTTLPTATPIEISWAGNASVTTVRFVDGKFLLLSYGDNAYLADHKTTFSQ